MERLRLVMGTGNDTPAGHDDGANGYLALSISLFGLSQGKSHEAKVSVLLFFQHCFVIHIGCKDTKT